ncbi:hypothetical protein IM40_01590 [Candidatus Paracaedimonas acanthamoebae]|nr:hypothetical protein IM40_00425 [Candidatus Paracaedimonas acanthamoebae]AIL12512.1 hypothetical protein IM40_01590 [Candidatus Paracaedimonas acanthamoebae]
MPGTLRRGEVSGMEGRYFARLDDARQGPDLFSLVIDSVVPKISTHQGGLNGPKRETGLFCRSFLILFATAGSQKDAQRHKMGAQERASGRLDSRQRV